MRGKVDKNMNIAFSLVSANALNYLFVRVWGILLIRRVWHAWKHLQLKTFTVVVPESCAERIKQELADPFWSSVDCRVITFADEGGRSEILERYDHVFPLNAVYPISSRYPGCDCITIDDARSLNVAERFLAESIRSKAHTWVAREINKRISLRISRFLADAGVSPNAISFTGLLLAIGAAASAAMGTYLSFVIAGALFQLNSIMDGCDGEVARLTYRTSNYGRKLDIVIDYCSILIFTVGSAYGIYRNGLEGLAIGGSAVILCALVMTLAYGFVYRNSPARHLMMEDEEGFIEKIVPRRFGKTWKECAYVIVFNLSRRDAYIAIICLLCAVTSPFVVFIFLMFLYLDTFLITYLSIKRIEDLRIAHA